MRIFPLMAIVALLFTACKSDKRYHDEVMAATDLQVQDTIDPIADIKAFQNKLNTQFKDKEESPLKESDRLKFEGLEFYDIDLKYRVTAKLELTPLAMPFEMPTTTSRRPLYKQYAIAHFVIDGQPYKLNIYQNQRLMMVEGYEDYLFAPFTDLTNGNGSYGGGRYMDLRMTEDEEITLDFNKTYNPYCAYNAKYSCPIPPAENDLPIAINAGVKAFKKG
ncbi:DUF1684 domain-containing protein [Sungkyunkwania multivorans]|uniref:DUF1684 domain-containing protein n=1 Tax=Sungkyunkwania multivorans TaxID=1173618 RepID=A0ABW3CX93_9FLAO